jgi:hypothetical protein
MLIMMYTKVHKTSFNGQGLTRKDDCFHGLLKDWTAAITVYFDLSFLHEHVLGINTKNFKKSVKRTTVI